MYYALVQGLFWAVMFGVGECYFSIFATYIHAPGFFFGLMAGVPSLLGPISQMFGADAVERTKNRKRLVQISVSLQGACYLPMAILPFVHAGNTAYGLLFAMIIIYYVCASFCVPAWNSWISVIVPAEQRCAYFAKNSQGSGFLSLITKLAIAGLLYLAGTQAIDAKESSTAIIFSAAFVIAGISRFGSFLFIRKMYEPKYEHPPDATFTFWQFIRRARESNFVRFVLFASLIQFGTQVAGPYFLPYAIYTLHFEQWQWVLLESVAAVASIITLMFWGSFSHHFGNKRTLQYTAVMVSVIPVLWIVSVNFYFLIAVNILSGLAWAGFNLSAFNYILDAVSPPKRARCVAYFNCLNGVGIFCGAMLGGWLNSALPATLAIGGWVVSVSSPFIYLLAISAAVRLIMGIFLVGAFRELRQVKPFSIRGTAMFYISEMRPPVGLRFGANAEPSAPEESAGEPSEEEIPEQKA